MSAYEPPINQGPFHPWASAHAGRRVCLQGTHDLESREGLCHHHRHDVGLHCMSRSFWHLDQHAATIKSCVRAWQYM
jgi:hypothetical protein